MVSNLIFATVLYLGRAEITNAHGFLDDIWFSVQTMGTIGYGYLAPGDDVANAIVAVESFYSIMLTALITGLFFARFSTPSARVAFSRVAIIGEHDGQRVLQFRMANERTTAILEATIRLYMTRDEKLANGESMRRVYDLPLRRNTSPVFALSFLAVHSLDAASPLYNMTAPQLRETNVNIIVTFTGIDDQLAAPVHSRYAYNVERRRVRPPVPSTSSAPIPRPACATSTSARSTTPSRPVATKAAATISSEDPAGPG